MGKRAFGWILNRTKHMWQTVDPVTQSPYDQFDFSAHVPAGISENGYTALAYGVKQIVGDGGAKGKGTTVRDRRAAQAKRYGDWLSGMYSFRDGTGSSSKFPDADVFAALLGLGKIKVTSEKPLAVRREAWADLTQAVRNKARVDPDVQAWLASQVGDDDEAEEALDDFLEG